MPRRVSIFMDRAMTVCSSACNSSLVDAATSMTVGASLASHRYAPLSTRQRMDLHKLDEFC